MTNYRNLFRCSAVLLCVLCAFAENVLSQNYDEIIRRGNDEQKRTALLQIRNAREEQASRVAIPALRDSSEIVRATAAFSVIFLPKDEAFAALSPLLKDKKELVRREAAYALGAVRNPAAISPLVQIYQKDKSIEVKNACVVALGEIGDAAAIDFLNGILQRKPNEDNDFERRSAARSIGQIAQFVQTGEIKVLTPLNSPPVELKIIETAKYENLTGNFPAFRSAVPILIYVLRNPNESDDAKREAAFALGAIGDAGAAEILRLYLEAEDNHLAQICAEALRKIEGLK